MRNPGCCDVLDDDVLLNICLHGMMEKIHDTLGESIPVFLKICGTIPSHK